MQNVLNENLLGEKGTNYSVLVLAQVIWPGKLDHFTSYFALVNGPVCCHWASVLFQSFCVESSKTHLVYTCSLIDLNPLNCLRIAPFSTLVLCDLT